MNGPARWARRRRGYARGASGRLAPALLLCGAVTVITNQAHADEPITLRTTWSGSVDFFATGTSMAVDGPDVNDTNVDTITQPATVTVATANIPTGSTLTQAFLYWSGTIPNSDCLPPFKFDDSVDFTPPGAAAPISVVADTCYCSNADATTYDVQVCRADVSGLILASGGQLTGNYVVDKFAASIQNRATDSASFSIVLVYQNPSLPPRDVALYDGVEGLSSSSKATSSISLGGIYVDTPAQGDLTWYTIEGDIGGGSPGVEQVVVTGNPGGTSLVLADALNPANNPMNRTINTTTPPQTATGGVDIDRFNISGALTAGDTSVDMLYSANTDKWWIAYNVVGINVFEPVFGVGSNKTGVLLTDADGNGVPSAGDTIRYTIQLVNTGTDAGSALIIDPIPLQADTWSLVSAGGGNNASTPSELIVQGVPVAVQASANVVFDMVIKDVPDQTVISNVASFDATPDGGDQGSLAAPDFVVRRDGDEDGVWDNDDNCPNNANTSQADADLDGPGDACDACPDDAANDIDGDGVCADEDNCPLTPNSNQLDSDFDLQGDACDVCPFDAANDVDQDLLCADVDNCSLVANPDQEDDDQDGIGNACDTCFDVDADGACEDVDNCSGLANPTQSDADGDGIGDACDDCAGTDDDGDGVCDAIDNCLGLANADQANVDGDKLGDACDSCPDDEKNDTDGDNVCGDVDNCPIDSNFAQTDEDGDGVGDACDEPVEVFEPLPLNQESGCDCRAAGRQTDPPGLWSLLTLSLALLLRRSRGRSNAS